MRDIRIIKRSASRPRAPAFSFQIFSVHNKPGVDIRYIHVVDEATKAQLLKPTTAYSATSRDDGVATLKRLRAFSPATAEKYEVRAMTPVQELTFRIYNELPTLRPLRSFIALSYRWSQHGKPFTPNGYIAFPTSAAMFEAVMHEVELGSEGLWFDQGCIDQQNKEEKEIAINSMDMVYSSARAVIVVFEDVLLTTEEVSSLRAYQTEYEEQAINNLGDSAFWELGSWPSSQPSNVQTARMLHNLLRTLLRSDWFNRAWCRHEFRRGREFVFLVPCELQKGSTMHTFLRFETEFFGYLLDVHLHPLGHDSLSRNSFSVAQALSLMGLLTQSLDNGRRRLWDSMFPEGNAPFVLADLSAATERFLSTSLDILSLSVGGDPSLSGSDRIGDANRDKVTIVLNSVDYGLTLLRNPGTLFKDVECQWQLQTLAFSARDAAVLCTKGSPIELVAGQPSWLCQPAQINSDNSLDTGAELAVPPFPEDARFNIGLHDGSEYIQLDLLFFRGHEAFSPRCDNAAASLISLSLLYGIECPRYGLGGYPTDDHAAQAANLKNDVLSCMLACGFNWIRAASRHETLTVGKHPMEEILSEENLDSLFSHTLEVNVEGFRTSQIIRDTAAELLALVESIIFSNVVYSSNSTSESPHVRGAIFPWNPRIINISPGEPGLIFIPPLEDIVFTVPYAIHDSVYNRLSRCWILQSRPERHNDDRNQWTLLGKSRILCTPATTKALSSIDEATLQQRVFGTTIKHFEEITSDELALRFYTECTTGEKEGKNQGSLMCNR